MSAPTATAPALPANPAAATDPGVAAVRHQGDSVLPGYLCFWWLERKEIV